MCLNDICSSTLCQFYFGMSGVTIFELDRSIRYMSNKAYLHRLIDIWHFYVK